MKHLLLTTMILLMELLVSELALAQHPVVPPKAGANGDCAVALAYSKVTGDIRINCTLYAKDLNPLVRQIQSIEKKQKLGQSQISAMVEAVNAMVGAVFRQQEQMAQNIRFMREEQARLPERVSLEVAKIIGKQLTQVEDGKKTIAAVQEEAMNWKSKYEKLVQEWEAINLDSKLWKQSRAALLQGNLSQAGQLLDQAITEKERKAREQQKELAGMFFQRGQVHDLQFNPVLALRSYQKAYEQESGNPDYGFAYATALLKQKAYRAAQPVFEVVLNRLREWARDNPTVYLPHVANTLNNLGVLYANTQLLKEAGEAYEEALKIRRELARENSTAHLPYVATTLNNKGVLYWETERSKEAGEAYEEALKIRRELARDNPAAYLPDVAKTLNNLGLLYVDIQRLKEAGKAYEEALKISRELARDNPAAYLPDVAMVLYNLGFLHINTQRLKAAGEAYEEALKIRRELARDNPAAYLPDVAKTLNNLGLLYADTQRLKEAGDAHVEALKIRRELARENPAANLPYVWISLVNLGNIYANSKAPLTQDEEAYEDAMKAYREMALQAPEIFPQSHTERQAIPIQLYSDNGQGGETAPFTKVYYLPLPGRLGKPVPSNKEDK